MKNLIIFSALLLAAIAGRSQTKITNFAWDNIDVDTVPTTLLATGQTTLAHWIRTDTVTPLYDTLKIIAEVYVLPYRYATGTGSAYFDDSLNHWVWHPDSAWSWDPKYCRTEKLLAWEIWRKNWQTMRVKSDPGGLNGYYAKQQLLPVELIKRLACNRKDELANVLQTWRVEW